MLIAAPAPSTGAVATSPSWLVAIAPLSFELAAGTVVAAVELVVGDAVAAAAPDALADALAAAPSADCLTFVVPELETAITTPSATASATGIAIGIASRAARLRPDRLLPYLLGM
jgi:hypothetical protein